MNGHRRQSLTSCSSDYCGVVIRVCQRGACVIAENSKSICGDSPLVAGFCTTLPETPPPAFPRGRPDDGGSLPACSLGRQGSSECVPERRRPGVLFDAQHPGACGGAAAGGIRIPTGADYFFAASALTASMTARSKAGAAAGAARAALGAAAAKAFISACNFFSCSAR